MRYLRLVAGVVLAASATVGILATVSSATHLYSGNAESVVTVSDEGPGGNVSCPGNTIKGPKIDPGANYGDSYITISGYNGKKFDWALTNPLGLHTFDMAIVIVKGGPNSAVYTYDFTTSEWDDWDTGLTAPTNPKNGKDYGISHIQVCYDPKGSGDN